MSDNEFYEQMHYATITDEVLIQISPTIVGQFKSIRTVVIDKERYKNDETFKKLSKEYYKAKEAFENYQFNIRNNQK